MVASPLYRRIYSRNSLYAAWRKVKESAFSSSSEIIRNEAKDFESKLPKSLFDIQSALSKKLSHFKSRLVSQRPSPVEVHAQLCSPLFLTGLYSEHYSMPYSPELNS